MPPSERRSLRRTDNGSEIRLVIDRRGSSGPRGESRRQGGGLRAEGSKPTTSVNAVMDGKSDREEDLDER